MYLAHLFHSNYQTQENLPSRLPFRIRLCVYGQIITMVNTDRGWSWTQPCQVYLRCNNTVCRKVLTGSCSKKCLFHGANNQLRRHFLHYFSNSESQVTLHHRFHRQKGWTPRAATGGKGHLARLPGKLSTSNTYDMTIITSSAPC